MDRRNYFDRDTRDGRNSYYKTDDPPNSRLFIIGHKALNEDDFRNAFCKFGTIEEIWVVKDKRTGENKGVTYIKFSKTSEAANALEEMNGTTIGDSNRNIKVVVAATREQGSKRDSNEDEKAQRLFVLVSKTSVVSELEDYFKQFGDIDYINIIKDRETRENKGYAYVKYHKFSHAADAFENCDRKYKAVFAEPRKNPSGGGGAMNPAMNAYLDNRYGMRMDYHGMGSGYMTSSTRDGSDMNPSGYSQGCGSWGNDFAGGGGGGGSNTRLRVVASSMINEDQLWKLFDIIPGLDYCQLVPADQHSGRSIGTVVYSSPEKAAYACEKLHGFEYPPGFRLIVKLDDQSGSGPEHSNRNSAGRSSSGNGGGNLQHLADSLAQAATSMMKNSGGGSGAGIPKMSELCSVTLPECRSLADIDSPVGARCFIVCTPPPPPLPILKDIFCRFGTLIEVYILPNRNCGYARYASKESARNAIQTLHGAEIYGGRIKVMEAEERDDPQRKRAKFD